MTSISATCSPACDKLNPADSVTIAVMDTTKASNLPVHPLLSSDPLVEEEFDHLMDYDPKSANTPLPPLKASKNSEPTSPDGNPYTIDFYLVKDPSHRKHGDPVEYDAVISPDCKYPQLYSNVASSSPDTLSPSKIPCTGIDNTLYENIPNPFKTNLSSGPPPDYFLSDKPLSPPRRNMEDVDSPGQVEPSQIGDFDANFIDLLQYGDEVDLHMV